MEPRTEEEDVRDSKQIQCVMPGDQLGSPWIVGFLGRPPGMPLEACKPLCSCRADAETLGDMRTRHPLNVRHQPQERW